MIAMFIHKTLYKLFFMIIGFSTLCIIILSGCTYNMMLPIHNYEKFKNTHFYNAKNYEKNFIEEYDTLIGSSYKDFINILSLDKHLILDVLYHNNKLYGFGVTQVKYPQDNFRRILPSRRYNKLNDTDTITVVKRLISSDSTFILYNPSFRYQKYYTYGIISLSNPLLDISYTGYARPTSITLSSFVYANLSDNDEIPELACQDFWSDIYGDYNLYEWEEVIDNDTSKILKGKNESIYEVLTSPKFYEFIEPFSIMEISFERTIYKNDIPIKSALFRFPIQPNISINSWFPQYFGALNDL